mgnify:CR=1 FL=1
MKNSYIVNQKLRMNSIQLLLSRPFSSLQLEEKCEVKRLGRPTPRLELTQEVKLKVGLLIEILTTMCTTNMIGCVAVERKTYCFVFRAFCLVAKNRGLNIV